MLKTFTKKYLAVFIFFLFIQLFSFLKHLNSNNPLPYLNLIVYFLTFLVIRETLPKTRFNKNLAYLFYILYIYLSVIITAAVFISAYDQIMSYILFFYTDIILKFLIFMISFYIGLYTLTYLKNNDRKRVLIAIVVSLIFIGINYYQYILTPIKTDADIVWPDYATKNYISVILSLMALLTFWYRYYMKQVVVTEFLSTIIFIFTLSNIVEALHFVAYQHNLTIYIYGQIFSFFLNGFILILWYARLAYLNSDISQENERYLTNYQYLRNLVNKPREGFLTRILSLISINYLSAGMASLILIIVSLYFVKRITFYLVLNTFFVLIAVALALFFSFISLRRDWQNRVGVFFRRGQKDENT